MSTCISVTSFLAAGGNGSEDSLETRPSALHVVVLSNDSPPNLDKVICVLGQLVNS